MNSASGTPDHSSPSELTPGTKISQYEIVRSLGAGGMGEVYLARDASLNRPVAIKFLAHQLSLDPDFRKRFVREAEATARLNHPNIVTIYEVGEYDGRPYFAMEFVEGQSLKEYIRDREIGLDKALQWAIQIGDAIAMAHDRGISHRDIKPGNILIDAYERPRLLDFGLATLEGSEHLTRTGSTLGTVQYMSPEQTLGEHADHRTDLFSFGVVLYELVTGKNPFVRENAVATGQAIMSFHPEPLAKYRNDVPELLQLVLGKLLEKDPNLRYQSARDVVADLKRMIRDGDSDITKTYIARSGPRVAAPRQASKTSIFGLGAFVLFTAAFLFYWFGIRDQISSATTGSAAWRNSIAVLPFRDFSPEQNQEFFCDGITDAIIGKLSSLEELKVISMTSVMRYKTPDRDLTKIGKELGVAAILEGSVQREGNRVRIRAQLIQVKDDAHLWSNTYDRELESIFAVQDEISHGIADVLEIKLLGSEETAFQKRGTDNLEAYSAYMKGRFYWRKRTEEHLRNSISAFETAIGLDSNYALAWSGLADAWGVLPGYSDYPTDSGWSKGKEAAAVALKLDDQLAEAHASMGLILWFEDDYEASRTYFEKAIDLNPGYAWSHTWYASLLIDLGEREAAIAQLERSLELDPLNTVSLNKLTTFKVADALWDEAERLYLRTIEIEPNARFITRYAEFLDNRGRFDEAIAQYQRIIDRYPADFDGYQGLARILARRISIDSAFAVIDRYASTTGDTSRVHYHRGRLHNMLSHYEDALSEFTLAVEESPDYGPAWFELAFCQNQLGYVDDAIASASKRIELEPENEYGWSARGRIYLMNGQFDAALRDFQQAVQVAPGYFDGIGLQAAAHLFTGNYRQAQRTIEDLKESRSIEAKADGRGLQATLYTLQGKFDDALETLDNGIIEDSLAQITFSVRQKLLMKVFLLEELGRLDEALEVLNHYVAVTRKHTPTETIAWRDYIPQLLSQQGKYDLALQKAEELKQDLLLHEPAGSLYGFYMAKGAAEFFAGHYREALTLYEIEPPGYRDSRNYFQTQFMLGRCYLEVGELENAIEGFEEFLSNYSYHRIGCEIWTTKARLYLAQAYERSGQLDKAIENYQLFLDQWKNAEPMIPSVEQAQASLTRLQS